MTVRNSLLDGLMQRLGGTANAATMFGAPVERRVSRWSCRQSGIRLWGRQRHEERRRSIGECVISRTEYGKCHRRGATLCARPWARARPHVNRPSADVPRQGELLE